MIIELTEEDIKGRQQPIMLNIFAIRSYRPATEGTIIFFDNEQLRVTEKYAEVTRRIKGEVAELVGRLLTNIIDQP